MMQADVVLPKRGVARSIHVVGALALMAASARALEYVENFNLVSGFPSGWRIVAPAATVEGLWLTLAPTGAQEPCVFAGRNDFLEFFDVIEHIEFDIAFPGTPAAYPFDHGGVLFCAAKGHAGRYANTCYSIDFLGTSPDAGLFRLVRFADSVEKVLVTKSVTAYAGRWNIDLADGVISFSLGGEVQFRFPDASFAGGHVGFWTYPNLAATKLAIDNLRIVHTPARCPVFEPRETIVLLPGAIPSIGLRIPYGANRMAPYEVTVTTSNYDIAPFASQDDERHFTKSFTSGESRLAWLPLMARFPGHAELTVAVQGEDCGDERCAVDILISQEHEQDFESGPGGWRELQPYVSLERGALVFTPDGTGQAGEAHAFAGLTDAPTYFTHISDIEFDLSFPGIPTTWPPDHGGVLFCCQQLANRWTTEGYAIDYLDHWFRYSETPDRGQIGGVGGVTAYAGRWAIEVAPNGVTFSREGTAQFSMPAPRWLGGFVGFWNYFNEGQKMELDNVRIRFGQDVYPDIRPAAAVSRPVNAPTSFSVAAPFEANRTRDYAVTVRSSAPEVAVPAGATDGKLDLTFPMGGPCAHAFQAECLAPGTTEFLVCPEGSDHVLSRARFTVRPVGIPGFCDDFARGDGPPARWTSYLANAALEDGALVVDGSRGASSGNEAWVWAGDPPRRIEGAASMSFRLSFLSGGADGVGRHGGFMWCADAPTARWLTRGYEIDWIDRAADRGYRIQRIDDGIGILLAAPTGDRFPLGNAWKLQFVGNRLLFSVDGTTVFNVLDATYREGYFGFWTWRNGTRVRIDDVVLGPCVRTFRRGDANADGGLDVGDAICTLSYLFGRQGDPCKALVARCRDAADANDDGTINIGDAVKILSHLFAHAGPLPDPFGACGYDPTVETPVDQTCDSYPRCGD